MNTQLPDCYGAWLTGGYDDSITLFAQEHTNFVVIDLQHGRITLQQLEIYLGQAARSGIPVYIRTASDAAAEINRILDLGGTRIIVPGINSVTQAHRVVDATFFPPRGNRSYGPLATNLLGSQPAELEENIELHLMIESAEALNHVEEIAAIDSVSGLFVGPVDLSLSCGLSFPGSQPEPELCAAMTRCAKAAQANNVQLGAYAPNAEYAQRWKTLGCKIIPVASDVSVLRRGIQLLFNELKN